MLQSVFVGDDYIPYAVEKARISGNTAFLKLKGIGDRNMAETLRNRYLYVAEKDLVPLPDEDAFYHYQIIGLDVVDTDGVKRGTIVDVENYPGNDLFVLEDDAGNRHLIPAVRQIIKNIDTDNRTMTIDVVDGLLD